ncbi:MAG: DUF4350 domain-containing protein [Prochlorotrichaceae cyanobacterium]
MNRVNLNPLSLNRLKQWWPLLLFCLILLVLALAPGQPHDRSGSTYSRDPEGYGAWYAYMEDRGTPVQRWRKSLADWETFVTERRDPAGTDVRDDRPLTLLRIHSQPIAAKSALNGIAVKQSRLITLGVKTPATFAPYRSHPTTPQGKILLDSSRRLPPEKLQEQDQVILADQFGVIAWQRSDPDPGGSTAIWINSPHLAANAYQDFPRNYEFLAELVTAAGGEVWVDEYLHGYRDRETDTTSGESLTWQRYLQQSSLMVILAQGCLLLILVWLAHNQRFGSRIPFTPPTTDNTIAYIRALAGVLRQVNNHQFVGETLGKSEQQYFQNHLGLRGQPLSQSSLGKAWEAQTGRSPQDIDPLLNLPQRCSDADLLQWLKKVLALHQSLRHRQ